MLLNKIELSYFENKQTALHHNVYIVMLLTNVIIVLFILDLPCPCLCPSVIMATSHACNTVIDNKTWSQFVLN